MGLFNQWKGAKIVWFHACNWQTAKRAFKRRRFFLNFNLKTFFCQVQQLVFLTWVSDVSLNLSFDLLVFSPLFVYLNKLDRSSFDHAFTLVRFSYKKIRLLLCLFALKSPLFCFQVLIRCNHKQIVWHWQARHQVNMIRKLSKL